MPAGCSFFSCCPIPEGMAFWLSALPSHAMAGYHCLMPTASPYPLPTDNSESIRHNVGQELRRQIEKISKNGYNTKNLRTFARHNILCINAFKWHNAHATACKEYHQATQYPKHQWFRGGYCAANNPFKLNSASVSTGLYKTYIGAFARHLVGLLCLCVLKTES